MPKKSLTDENYSVGELTGELIKIKYVPVSAIAELTGILLKGNPKKHDLNLLSQSIIENGFIDPPKWDKNLNGGKGGIVYGNGRLEALILTLTKLKNENQQPPKGIGITKDGEWCVPIKFGVDAESEIAALRLAIDHNNLTLAPDFSALEQAKLYDEEMYKDILIQLNEADSLPLTINDHEELESILQVINENLGLDSDSEKNLNGQNTKDNSLPDVFSDEPRAKLGDIWALGRHRLLCGDSTDPEQLNKLLRDVSGKKITPDLIWSDPPYGMKCQKKDGRIGSGDAGRVKGLGLEAKSYPLIHGDDTIDIAIASFEICEQLYPNAIKIFWGANHYSQGLPSSSCWIVWDKLNGDTCFADCELAWTNLKIAVRKFDFLWNGALKQGEAAKSKRIHPNQKPVEMVTWFWDNYCKDAITCFDPFLGSGTSIIAAENNKQKELTVYGCEIMPIYCEVIMQRWEQKTGLICEKIGEI